MSALALARIRARHTVDGYTSYPALAASMEAELRRYLGCDLIPTAGCVLLPMPWAEAEALVEFEISPADGDAEDPRYFAGICEAVRVLINGRMVSAEVAGEDQCRAWEDAAVKRWRQDADDARAEERDAWRKAA